jgi:hypothetical protein
MCYTATVNQGLFLADMLASQDRNNAISGPIPPATELYTCGNVARFGSAVKHQYDRAACCPMPLSMAGGDRVVLFAYAAIHLPMGPRQTILQQTSLDSRS